MPDLLDDLAASVGPPVVPMQGSYSSSVSASASTHSGGGAIDVGIKGWSDADVWDLLVKARKRGLVLSKRTPAQGFVLHAHGIVDGCPHLSGLANPVMGTAAWQVREYRAGRNGLAGRGADDGPRDFVGATWWGYQKDNPTKPPAPSHPLEGDDMIVAGTVAQGDNSPDGISGKIMLCLPGFPEPKWLSGDEWAYIGRVFPYWASLPGSPFYYSQVAAMNAMIQPVAQYHITPDAVRQVVGDLLKEHDAAPIDPAALEAAIRDALANIIAGVGGSAARALPDPSVKMATTDMVPRLRGEAGRTLGTFDYLEDVEPH